MLSRIAGYTVWGAVAGGFILSRISLSPSCDFVAKPELCSDPKLDEISKELCKYGQLGSVECIDNHVSLLAATLLGALGGAVCGVVREIIVHRTIQINFSL